MSEIYNKQLASIKGSYKLIMVWCTESNKITCQSCGHIIKNVYVIENIETKEKINVGSECVKNLLGDNESERILKAVKTIQSEVKIEYEKPIKNAQLKVFIAENENTIRYFENDARWHNNLYDNVIWRVNNNTNADMTKKNIKDSVGLDCKFTFTKEQKQELKQLQDKAINDYLTKRNSK